jgi:hypothetical protein
MIQMLNLTPVSGRKEIQMSLNRIKSRNGQPLSMEQIQKAAPSVFAGQPYEKQSDRYAFIPTSDIIQGMRENGFLPFAASQSLSRIPGKEFFTKHQVRFRMPHEQLTQVGDTVFEAILTNSHDGTSCYTVSGGMERLACLNGMTVSESFIQSVRVRHVGNTLEQVIEGTRNLIRSAPKLIEVIKYWKSIILSEGEQKIFAESALALRFEDNSPVLAERLLTVRRTADTGSDLWTVFNRIQENAVRGGLRYTAPVQDEQGVPVVNRYGIPEVRKARTREVKGIDQSNRLNRELFTLAEKMAELKF